MSDAKADTLIQQLINLIDPEGAGPNIDWDKARDAVQRWSGDGMNRLPLASMDALLDEIEAISSKHGGRALYRAAVQRWALGQMDNMRNLLVRAYPELRHDKQCAVRCGALFAKCDCDIRELSAEVLAAVSPPPEPKREQVTDGGRNPYYEGLFDGETEDQRAERLRSAPPPEPKTDAAFQDPLYCPSPVERREFTREEWAAMPCAHLPHNTVTQFHNPDQPCPLLSEPKPAQEPPYRVRAFWSPDRKYIATACVSSDDISLLDDDGNIWEPTGPEEDMAAKPAQSAPPPAKPDEGQHAWVTEARELFHQTTFDDGAISMAEWERRRDALLATPRPSRLPCRISEYDGAYRCTVHHRKWGAISNPDEPCEGWGEPERMEFFAVVTERRDAQPGPFDGPYLHGKHLKRGTLRETKDEIAVLNTGAFAPLGWARVARVTVLGEET